MIISPTSNKQYTDLAPMILRQRLVIEGIPSGKISDKQIIDYLTKLSDELGMRTLLQPVTHNSATYGWSGWIHWETSGAHFYAWEQPMLFFSVDIYTCKEFGVEEAVAFTEEYFDAKTLSYRSF